MKISNKSLIHKRMKCFVEFIAPDPDKREDTKRQADEIRKCIREKAKEEGYIVLSEPSSGSFAKKSGLRRHLLGKDEVEGQDIDIAFILKDKDKDGNSVGCMVHKFEGYLNKCWPNSDVGQTKSSATISYQSTKLRFDAVPLIETSQQDIQKLIRTDGSERKTSVEKHNYFVKKRNEHSNGLKGVVKFNDCVRLIKWWRYQRQSESGIFGNQEGDKKVPSFLLDLLCAKAYDKLEVFETYPETLCRWFAYLADLLVRRQDIVFNDFIKRHSLPTDLGWKVIDPMDDTNNIVASWKDYEVEELLAWFNEARDRLTEATRHDWEENHTESLNCLVSQFGNSIKNQCKEL